MKDLHIHTKYSDGELDEFEIIKEVKSRNITEFAVADHDTIEGSKRVFNALKKQNNNLVFHSAIELTCRVNEFDTGVNVHLLVQDFDYNNKELLSFIDEISNLRKQKANIMVEYVEKVYNISIPKDLLQEKIANTQSFGKPHLYSIMQTIGNFDRKEYYDIMDKLDTSKLKLDAKQVITTLKNCKVFLAHPIEIMHEYNYDISKIEKLIQHLKSLGLYGVETHHSSQTKELQTQLSNIAKKYNLQETFGSDFHGENVKPGLKIGQIQKEI